MGREINPTLNVPQAEFLTLNAKYGLYVAGFGAGKTWALAAKACQHYWEYPKANRGYFGPSYAAIRDIYYPTIEEVAADWGLRVVIRQSNKEIDFYSGRQYRGTTICRSMDNPTSIIGFKITRADIDEIDTLPMNKAEHAWRKIIARLRLEFGGQHGADVGTTPEGYRFVYNQWVKEVNKKPEIAHYYQRVHASTYDNELNLPDDYIDGLLASYPENLITAYINGEFVNLTTGTVYSYYNRKLNRSREKVRPGDRVFIGMDFNVGRMSAVAHVERDVAGVLTTHAVHEFVKILDTPAMIDAIRTEYGVFNGDRWILNHPITVYPDASGGSRSSANASVSDIQMLRAAGFAIEAPAANPPVKDRVLSMNTMFRNALGGRRYFINDLACPTYASNLEQQAFNDAGVPDKTQGADHTNDGAGYYIHRRFPVVRRSVRLGQMR